MRVLVTGSRGFVGKNLVQALKVRGYNYIDEYHRGCEEQDLDVFTKRCDFVFHLAGVNRPKDNSEFMKGNLGFTEKLLEYLRKHDNKAPIVVSSSIKAEGDSLYGQSKRAKEDAVFEHGKKNDVDVHVYRLPNLFGKWSRPNYNSVVATFCHNVARGLPIEVENPDVILTLAYIDDVVDEFIQTLEDTPDKTRGFRKVSPTHSITLQDLAETLKSFRRSRENIHIPDMASPITKKLYSTYLSYLPEDAFSYPLTEHQDDRGTFAEMLRTYNRGQVSVNISKPGVTKGNHWHQSKVEKFLVVSGEGLVRFRKIGDSEIIEYPLSDKKLEVLDIPPGYTHNIVNTGNKDLVTIMWANEEFDPQAPDTYREEV